MGATARRACIWSGVAFVALFSLGFGVVAGYLPPPNPANSAAKVAERYREDANAIRAGMLISMYALVLYVPWVAALAVPMWAVTEHPGVGRYLMPGTPLGFSGIPRQPVRRAPLLGEHTEEVLAELLELTSAEVGRLETEGTVAIRPAAAVS